MAKYDILIWGTNKTSIIDQKKVIMRNFPKMEEEIVDEVLEQTRGENVALLAIDGDKDEFRKLGKKLKKEGLDVEVKSVNRKYNQIFPRFIGHNPIAKLSMSKNKDISFSKWLKLMDNANKVKNGEY